MTIFMPFLADLDVWQRRICNRAVALSSLSSVLTSVIVAAAAWLYTAIVVASWLMGAASYVTYISEYYLIRAYQVIRPCGVYIAFEGYI